MSETTPMTESRRLVAKLVAGSNVLRDAGVNMYEYTEQLTFLLFLKMADERATRPLNPEQVVPDDYSWSQLLGRSGEELEDTYNHILRALSSQPGVLGTIYRGAQNKNPTRPTSRRSSLTTSTRRTGRRQVRTSTGTPTRNCSSEVPGTRRRLRASTSPRAR